MNNYPSFGEKETRTKIDCPKSVFIKISTVLLVSSIIVCNPYKSNELFAAEKKPNKTSAKGKNKKKNIIKKVMKDSDEYSRQNMYSAGMTKDFVDAYFALKKLIDDDILSTWTSNEFMETYIALKSQLDENKKKWKLNSDFQFDMKKVPISLKRLGLNPKILEMWVTENNWSTVTIALQNSSGYENLNSINPLHQPDVLKRNLWEKWFQNAITTLNKLLKENIWKWSLDILRTAIYSWIWYLVPNKNIKSTTRSVKIENRF